MAESPGPRYRLGIDIGGTFTDATLIEEGAGRVHTAKVLSTPQDPSLGFMEAALRVLGEALAARGDVRSVVHGTTVATNAIIEGKLARTAFVTTVGFRDMLEIARQIRPSLYDPLFRKPPPLVPRHLCFEVPERLDARGHVLQPLDEEAVRRVAHRLKREGVESIAVCLLHGYLDGRHEQRIGAILGECFPADAISLSSEVAPEFREYLRASTTVINAGIRRVVHRYLTRIEERLCGAGINAGLLVMQSSGGVLTSPAAGEKPVFMVESGPAAGVNAATYLGEALGAHNLISLDMGGTTAKVGLVRDGRPRITREYQVGATAQSGVGALAADGYPVRTPVIDLVEIGAGGGSIAWIDSGGALRVGPHSAGADPGPVCYGAGGSEPTVTDANLVLGRLDPDSFLGGEMRLDLEAARMAIERRCAAPLGLDVVAAAHGIVEIANTAMVNALQLVSVQRGYDPRDFVLVAFGGGGPLHANALAAEMALPRTIVPRRPGVFSSLGLLVTDLKHEHAVSLLLGLRDLEAAAIEARFTELEQRGAAELARDGVAAADISFLRQADLRYVGQSYELPVPLPPGPLTLASLTELEERFHATHDRENGFSAPGEPVELVSLRLTAAGRLNKPSLARLDAGGAGAPEPRAVRRVYLEGGFVECPIHDREALAAGVAIEGPAIVEERDSTTLVYPGYSLTADGWGNLVLAATELLPIELG
jgi:N-methylhydantoinase A